MAGTPDLPIKIRTSHPCWGLSQPFVQQQATHNHTGINCLACGTALWWLQGLRPTRPKTTQPLRGNLRRPPSCSYLYLPWVGCSAYYSNGCTATIRRCATSGTTLTLPQAC
jgi:hypothetical protein